MGYSAEQHRQYDSGWKTGVARARHDLAVLPLYAAQQCAHITGPYGTPVAGLWDRGYVEGYRAVVHQFLR